MITQHCVQDVVANSACDGLIACPRDDNGVGNKVPQDQRFGSTILDNLEANELRRLYMSNVCWTEHTRKEDDGHRRRTTPIAFSRLN